jgi:hypothetical protein
MDSGSFKNFVTANLVSSVFLLWRGNEIMLRTNVWAFYFRQLSRKDSRGYVFVANEISASVMTANWSSQKLRGIIKLRSIKLKLIPSVTHSGMWSHTVSLLRSKCQPKKATKRKINQRPILDCCCVGSLFSP